MAPRWWESRSLVLALAIIGLTLMGTAWVLSNYSADPQGDREAPCHPPNNNTTLNRTCPPMATPDGTIVPQPLSPLPPYAYQQAVNHTGHNAYAVAVKFSERFADTLVKAYCPSYCVWTPQPAYQNVTDPLAALGKNWSQANAVAWVNGTGACWTNSTCPTATLTCNGTAGSLPPAPSVSVAKNCYRLSVTWGGRQFNATSHALPSFVYTVTRIVVLTENDPTNWQYVGQLASQAAYLTVPSSTYWAPSVSNWSAPSAAWVVPFPAGNWSSTSVVVTPVPGSTPLATSAYTTYSRYVLLQWTGGVSSTVGKNVTLTYTVSASLACGGPYRGAAKLTNASYEVNATSCVPSIVVVTLGNQTSDAFGFLTVSATWANPYGQTFVGGFVLQGGALGSAKDVSVTVDGVPVPTAQFTYGGGSVALQAGVAPVGNGTSVVFSVTMQPATPWSFTTPIFYLSDGAPINSLDLMLIAASVIAVLAYLIGPSLGFGPLTVETTLGFSAAAFLLLAWMVAP